MTGRLNGRYELGEVLGYGGMSEVRAARDTLLNRDVAIKILRADLARDHNFLERFRREARNSARLNHPNIVALYDTGEYATEQGVLSYIVMERLGGHTLRDLITTEGALPIKQALRIIASVANALDYSHQMGIVHRDIKPANIMMTLTGVPKVMDFGISRAADDMQALTQTATVFGTAQYISPEHAMGNDIDFRADIYALGCVLYECLAGEPPFQAETAVAVACKHVQEQPAPPSTIRSDISPELDAVVLKALCKDPNDRYQSAGELQEALENILGEKVASRITLPDYQKMGATLAADDAPTEAIAASTSILPLAIRPTGNAGIDSSLNASRLPRSGATDAAASANEAGGANGASGASGANGSGGDPSGSSGDGVSKLGNGYGTPGFGVAGYGPLSELGKPHTTGELPELIASGVTPPPPAAPPNKKRRNLIIALSTVLVLLFGGAGVYYGVVTNPNINQAATDTLNNYEGRDAEPVYQLLTRKGYTVNLVVNYIRTQTHGTIMRTSPPGGAQIAKDEPITLYIATGGEPIKVPKIYGLEVDKAKIKLQLTGIPVESANEKKPSEPSMRNKAVGTSIPAGSEIEPNAPIDIYIGSGRRPVRLPSVEGMDADKAEEILTDLKLKVRTQMVRSSMPRGKVVRVQAGPDLAEGDIVTLMVSDGSLITMPSLVGATPSEVISILRDAGWQGQLNQNRTGTLNLAKLGRVAKQYPEAGAEVDRDTPVSITIYELNLP